MSASTATANTKYPKIEPGGGLILAWQLKGKKVLLVGGGMVAAGEPAVLGIGITHNPTS